MNKGKSSSADRVVIEPELELRNDPSNPLDKMRKNSDLSSDFLRKFWLYIDNFDEGKAEAQYSLAKRYVNVLRSDPTAFRHPTQLEMPREDMRMLAHEQFTQYLSRVRDIQPLSETLTDIEKSVIMHSIPCTWHQDPMVKVTVSMQLAYKTIQNLGTDKHSKWLKRMESLDDISCFALTELGHGSNVRGILTTATYDREAREFVINSPSNESMKFWIGGAGKTANICCCFAQLIVNGKDEGPHAFVIPLRDRKTHLPFPGITLGDCGKKEGQDGIDNGFILFDHVRIPKENMLNRLSDINDDGVFSSPIKSPDQRFALSIGSLSVGRILVIGNMNLQIQQALKIAIRFAVMRKQFGSPKSKVEQPLIDYQLHQYRLFPYAAYAFSFSNAFVFIKQQWAQNEKKIFKQENFKLAELHALISVMKAIVTWTAYKCVHDCRMACGGLGYSYYSKFSILLGVTDVNQTWEGDNNVLLQQTFKFLLDQYKKKMQGKIKLSKTVEWITTEDISDQKCAAETIEDLVHPQTLKALFEYRCNKLLQRTAISLGQQMMNKQNDPFTAWNNHQVFGGQDLATSYGECVMLQLDTAFLKQLDSVERKQLATISEDTKLLFKLLFQLSALTRVIKDIGTWYEDGYLSCEQGEMMREHVKTILGQLKRFAIPMTDAMQPEDDILQSMIAPANGDLYGQIVNTIYASPGVFSRISNWQDIVKPKM